MRLSRLPITEADVRQAFAEVLAERWSMTEAANHLGCCGDTFRRYLGILGLRAGNSAKHVVRERPATWERPCLCCGSKERRPRGQYRCRSCLDKGNAAGLPEGWVL